MFHGDILLEINTFYDFSFDNINVYTCIMII